MFLVAGNVKSERLQRNKDIRFLCNILHNKYFVDISRLARALHMQRQYYYDFVRGDRDLLYPNLYKIESFIFDLYETILEQEMEMNGLVLESTDERETELNL